MTEKPKVNHRLIEAARQAKDMAANCQWPACKCPQTEPGTVDCAFGGRLHYRTATPSHKDG